MITSFIFGWIWKLIVSSNLFKSQNTDFLAFHIQTNTKSLEIALWI